MDSPPLIPLFTLVERGKEDSLSKGNQLFTIVFLPLLCFSREGGRGDEYKDSKNLN
jgi:hypothetical protein